MSAEFAELVLEASPMVALVREARGGWPIVYASDAMMQFGYSALEVEDQRLNYKELIHPLDRDSVAWSLETAIDSGADNFTESYRLQTATGATHWVSDWTSISRDGQGQATQLTTLLLDITKQHETEASMEAIAETLPGALFHYRLFPNGSDRIEYVNPGCADVWEYDMAQLRHDPTLLWEAILDEDIASMQHSVMTSFQSLRMWEHEWRIRTPNGRVKWLRGRGRPSKQPDDSVIWHTIVLDISELKQANEEAKRSLQRAVQVLARVAEARDCHVASHHYRVGQMAKMVAEAMQLDAHTVEGIALAASVHDIGELFVAAELLGKPGPLTESEMQQVRLHCEAGAGLLAELSIEWPLDQIVLQHHERPDGTGYPSGLQGADILLEAQVLAVAEVIDAMSHPRAYRDARKREEVIDELASGAGSRYHPEVTATALRLLTGGAFDVLLPPY